MIRLLPAYQAYIWGGNRIAQQFHRSGLPAKVAESWEFSDRVEGMSVVAEGANKGKTLAALVDEMGERLVGRKCARFPLLIKLIDAKESLSVQVHPSNTAEPKTECWIALASSQVFDGFKQIVSKDQVKAAIAENTLPELLHKTNLAPGDADLIPGGTIHAILGGSFVLEVQQNSNTTYRLYDWGRPRPLHLKEGLEVLHLGARSNDKQVPQLEEKGVHLLVDCPFFQIRRLQVDGEMQLKLRPDTFIALFVVEGKGEIVCDGVSGALALGSSWLIPAFAKTCHVFGRVTLLATSLPPAQGH